MVNAIYRQNIKQVIYRGTTPTINFDFPYSQNEVSKVIVTFSIKDSIVFEKQLNECTIQNNKIYISLTQSETLSLENDEIVEIQIRTLLTNNKAIASDISKVRVKEVLNESVLVSN